MSGDSELSFKPLTEGLGFHPFSNGLPYAPREKNAIRPRNPAQTSQPASGATAAGKPRFDFSTLPARLTQPPPKAPVIEAPTLPPAPTPAAVAALQPSLVPEPFVPEYGMGYLAKRALAYLLDTVLNTSLCVAALSSALWKQGIESEMLFNPGVILIAGLFLGFFNWALITAQEVVFGTSVGKRIFGLTLDGSATAIFLRAFFFLSSLGFLGVGLIWAIFNPRRRCWHDLMVDLQPHELQK